MTRRRRPVSRQTPARGKPPPPPILAPSGEPASPAAPRWRWRTFPVLAAFVIGLLVASFINGRPSNGAAAAVQIAAIAGFGYVLAHLFVTNVIVAGRVRRRRRAIERGEQPSDDYEDEVVYPGQ